MKQIDARGLSCPEPVVLVQKGVQESPEGFMVLVDAMVCVENIKRFAFARGYQLDVTENDGEYTLVLKK
ncbi:MAG: sulfurtransferase TusA family protein [Clostridia bacterium]